MKGPFGFAEFTREQCGRWRHRRVNRRANWERGNKNDGGGGGRGWEGPDDAATNGGAAAFQGAGYYITTASAKKRSGGREVPGLRQALQKQAWKSRRRRRPGISPDSVDAGSVLDVPHKVLLHVYWSSAE